MLLRLHSRLQRAGGGSHGAQGRHLQPLLAFKLPAWPQLQLAHPGESRRGHHHQVSHASAMPTSPISAAARAALTSSIPCRSFRNFDVAESGRCAGDRLLLTPSWSGESALCGSALPPPFISARGRVWLYFHSQTNSTGQAQGFRLSYIRGRQLRPETRAGTF